MSTTLAMTSPLASRSERIGEVKAACRKQVSHGRMRQGGTSRMMGDDNICILELTDGTQISSLSLEIS
jgi:hypothetical protein